MHEASDWNGPMWQTTGFRLIKLGELVQATTAALFAPLGISARHFHVLAAADQMSDPSQRELSRVLGIDPNVMVGVIDELERLDLARRIRNPQDRRRYIVAPTDRARALLDEAWRGVRRAEEEFFADLSQRERSTLHDLAGRLLTAHPRLTKRE